MGFTKAELARFADGTVDDLIGPGLRLLLIGINPGLWTVATGTHFCHPSNRFYPAMRRAGMIDFEVDPDSGMTAAQRSALTGRGIGITNLVSRATVRADELGLDELRLGAIRITDLVGRTRPRVVAFAGITAYRKAFDEPKAVLGPRADGIHGSEVWVLPNPSGLNAHQTVDTLAGWFRRAADAAGIE
jgi:double-stranded uracil-DNA glycosylase